MLAAIAGMAAPACVFIVIVGLNSPLVKGWAIPAATDIAFAMGVLGILGNRVPASLRLFLLTVAIVDDIGAVLVISAFYTENIYPMWLAASAAVFGVMVAMNRFGVSKFWPFILVALVLWVCVLFSGVHATVAGVAAALTIPMRTKDGRSMLERLEHGLAPWSAYLVVPVFGFANAGVNLTGMGIKEMTDPLPIAIAAGLVLGKQAGHFRHHLCRRQAGHCQTSGPNANWVEIWGITILCGIGFTMSLFISGLAFEGNDLLIDEAKIGILGGSMISAIMGYVVLRLTTTHPPKRRSQGAADAVATSCRCFPCWPTARMAAGCLPATIRC